MPIISTLKVTRSIRSVTGQTLRLAGYVIKHDS